MASLSKQDARFGIHESGAPLSLDESNLMQSLDVLRLTKTLASREQLLHSQTTAELRGEFEDRLKEVIATPDGDPEQEWHEFLRHKEEQVRIMGEVLNNPEGQAAFEVYVRHMAKLFADATKELKVPIEPFERRFEQYFEVFSDASDRLSQERRIQYHQALQSIESREHFVKEKEVDGGQFLIGHVSAPRKPAEPNILIDFTVRNDAFDFRARNKLAK